MSTPAVSNEENMSVGPPGNGSQESSRSIGIGWFNTSMLALGGVAALGFLVVMGGSYLFDNVAAILAGTIIILAAAIAWIALGVYFMVSVIKSRFVSHDRAKPRVQ